jgi:hypothetical protein
MGEQVIHITQLDRLAGSGRYQVITDEYGVSYQIDLTPDEFRLLMGEIENTLTVILEARRWKAIKAQTEAGE